MKKGSKHIRETIQKMSESHKGTIVWNIGLTKETDERVKKMSMTRKGQLSGMLGKHHSEETKRKIGSRSKGRAHTIEAKKRIGEGNWGEKNGNWDGGDESTFRKRARIAWKEYWGEEILDGYVIHHLDENCKNNEIANLTMLTCGAHVRLHKLGSGE